ncbi:MAG: PTS ascorbate transporter subunit IIC [Oscillospiraceae bacterium]|nr:PTS ascorbate transporter subunit IIC [Oscillospiraceae bacterium]MCL2279742.1 PTS ascorbate transporter subunit IIC [Oscillospiraceae bacterium]
MEALLFLLSVVRTPALILALVALVGLIVQRKTGSQIFAGTVKTALGLLILSGGVGVLITAIIPFVVLFEEVFNLSGFATGSELITGAMLDAVPLIASTSALIMGIGFLVNIVLARFTPLKYIFLTGHMMWMSSVLSAYVLYAAGFGEAMIIVIGSVIQGAFLTLLPAISQPIMRKVTGNNDIALAHLTTLGTVPSAYIGKLVGNPEKSAEDMKLPKGLAFFKDTAVAVSVVMLIFYLVLVIIAGPARVEAHAGDTNFLVFGLLQGLGFAAGVLILLQGVRMFLGEIVPAFKGISDKLVPNAIPALDVPVIFPYAPNSLMIGFIMAVVGMLVAMATSGAIFGVVPLVSIIGAFFTGGVAGIFGNALGGRRGAIASGFAYGFILIFLSGATFRLFDGFSAIGIEGVGHDCVDAMVAMVAFQNPWVGLAILGGAFVLLSFFEVRYRKRTHEAAEKSEAEKKA